MVGSRRQAFDSISRDVDSLGKSGAAVDSTEVRRAVRGGGRVDSTGVRRAATEGSTEVWLGWGSSGWEELRLGELGRGGWKARR